MPDLLLYGWKAIAEFVGCSPRTAVRYYRRRKLPVSFIGGVKPAGDPGQIREWLQRQKKPPGR